MDRLYLHIINRNTVCNKVLHSLEVVAQSALSTEKYSPTKGIKHLRKSKETTYLLHKYFLGSKNYKFLANFCPLWVILLAILYPLFQFF